MGHAEALAPGLLVVVDVDADDHVGAGKLQALDDVEADAAEAEDDGGRADLDLGGVDDRADAGRDAAADVADLVEGRVLALTLATAISGSTVKFEKVEQPM
jgi:hypothetical protein